MGDTPNKKRGRPKTSVSEKLSAISLDFQKIQSMAELGMTDVQIGIVIGVSEATMTLWKKDPEFFSALKKGKELADTRVVESLYRRATGYEHSDIYFSQYEGVVTETPYTKHYPPDTLACIFWLKNRQRGSWHDRTEVEHSGTVKFVEDKIE
jgi:hypothetical protein